VLLVLLLVDIFTQVHESFDLDVLGEVSEQFFVLFAGSQHTFDIASITFYQVDPVA